MKNDIVNIIDNLSGIFMIHNTPDLILLSLYIPYPFEKISQL